MKKLITFSEPFNTFIGREIIRNMKTFLDLDEFQKSDLNFLQNFGEFSKICTTNIQMRIRNSSTQAVVIKPLFYD